MTLGPDPASDEAASPDLAAGDMGGPAAASIQLGRYTFDRRHGRLVDQAGQTRSLRPKAFRLLAYLLGRPNQMMSRTALNDAIWPGLHVTTDSLNQLVREIRRAIDDADRAVLQTIPGRGYVYVPAGPAGGDPPGQSAVQPPGQPSAGASGRVPLSVTSFVGRQRELALLDRLIRTQRLVTITGIGGIGKTRLLHQFAAPAVPCVDLCPVSDEAGLLRSMIDALGGPQPDRLDRAAVAAALHRQGGLVLIDNAEHLLAEVGALLSALLAECDSVTFVVTSRMPLNVAGEAVLRLEPFKVPPAAGPITAAGALDFDAVRLFMDRVKLVDPGFQLDDGQAGVVSQICRSLDGIALAIEMAVPRMQVLTLEQIRERLGSRFELLTLRGTGGLARQRSLRSVFEWSWDLLSASDQDLLARVSTFTGGVSLPALVAMREEEAEGGEWSVIDGLTELVRASLVISEPEGGQPRFRLLETTRAFVETRVAPQAMAALRRRHLHVLVQTFERADAEWPRAGGRCWAARYGLETDNLRAALAWGFGPEGDTEAALRLAAASLALWWELPNMPLREAWHWFDVAAARIGPATPAGVAGRVLLGQSWRDIAIGDGHNGPAARRAVALLREAGAPMALGAALWRLGSTLMLPGSLDEAAAVQEEAIAVLRPLGHSTWLSLALVRRGTLHAMLGELGPAVGFYEEGLAMAEHIGCRLAMALGSSALAEAMFRSGDPDAGISLMTRLRREMPDAMTVPMLSTMTTQLAANGQVDEALEAIGTVLAAVAETGLGAATARAVETLALLAAQHGEPQEAARLFGWVLTIHAATRCRTGGRLAVFNRLNEALREQLRPERMEALLQEGAAWSQAAALSRAAPCHAALAGGRLAHGD